MTQSVFFSEPLTIKQLINSFDWNNTSLGSRYSWPPNLKSMLSLVLNTSVPMVVYWGKDNVTLYNDAYAKLIGSKHPALFGRPLIDIWPERKLHFNRIVSAVYQKETIKYTTPYKTPGNIKKNSLKTTIEVTFSPILDENNQVQGMLSITTEPLEQMSSSTQTIDQLIGGLAHDFNTLLAGIIGNLELMKMRIEQNKVDILPRYIDAAQKAATQASDITHQLLSFSRRQTLVPQIIDPNHTIQALLDTFNNFIKQDPLKQSINLQIQLETNIWPIFCDPEQLKNAILHIFTNAYEATHSPNGQISIQTQNITVTTTHPIRKFIKPDDYIAIIIQDNGDGMTPEITNRAIDPFFTTKPLGKRAGLGLSMAYGFTKQSNGHLTITSNPRTGTMVSLYLPRYHHPLTIRKLHNYSAKIKQPGALVISQDNHLCMLLSETLEDLGYSMTIAQCKKETFIVLQDENIFNFIIIDTDLLSDAPKEFLKAIHSNYPDLSILFVKNHKEIPEVLKQLSDRKNFFIQKPLTRPVIVNCIKAIEDLKTEN